MTRIATIGRARLPKQMEVRYAEIVKVPGTPDIVQHLTTLGIVPVGSSAQRYAETICADLRNLGKLVKESGECVD